MNIFLEMLNLSTAEQQVNENGHDQCHLARLTPLLQHAPRKA